MHACTHTSTPSLISGKWLECNYVCEHDKGTSELDKGADVQVIFFDLQKAFDSVPHGPLIDKLISLNVPTVLVSWISSYLYNRKQQVGVCVVNSDPFNVTSGVSQGSALLGPLLFQP